MTRNDLKSYMTVCFSWMVTMNLPKSTKRQKVVHISEHLVMPLKKKNKSSVMYHIKHSNRHVLEPTVIDICKPILKINRKINLQKNTKKILKDPDKNTSGSQR